MAWYSGKLHGQHVILSEPYDPYTIDHYFSPDDPDVYTPWACNEVFGEVDHPRRRCCGSCPADHRILLPPDASDGLCVCGTVLGFL